MHDKFTRLRSALAETDEEKLDLALNQTRKLRENLESVQRQIQNLSRNNDEQTQEGTQKTGKQNTTRVQAGPGGNNMPPQQMERNKLDRLNDELAQGLKDLEFIQQSTQVDTSLSRQAAQLNQNLQGIIRTFSGGDQRRIQIIENLMLVPLKGFEAELTQKLEIMKNKEKLFIAREEKIPPEYEALVEKYYETLSKTKQK